MYVERHDAQLGDFWSKAKKSVKKFVAQAKKKIRTDIDPRKLKEKLSLDSEILQKDLNKIVAPKAEQRAKEITKLQQQAEVEEDAIAAEALELEKARRTQLISSGITLAGLAGIGLAAFVMLRPKHRRK